jgi:Tol biopolymer transport system component
MRTLSIKEKATATTSAVGAVLAVLLVAVPPSHATFGGHNGRLLFEAQVGANRQLFTIEPNGTGLTQLTHFRDSGGTNGAWSKDGSRIVFTRHWNPEKPNEKIVLYTIRADGTGAKALPKGGDIAVEPNWFPNGRRIIFLEIHSGRLEVINATGTGLRPAGIPGVGGDSVCVFPDGERVAFLRPSVAGNDAVRAIFVAGLFGHGLKRITPWGGYADKIDCSPDGKRIVFSKPAFGQGGKSSNVYTTRTDGSDLVQLTHDTGGSVNDGADSWSPNGTKIAFVSNRTGTYQIWTMNADGTGAKQLTHGPEAHLAAWGSHL